MASAGRDSVAARRNARAVQSEAPIDLTDPTMDPEMAQTLSEERRRKVAFNKTFGSGNGSAPAKPSHPNHPNVFEFSMNALRRMLGLKTPSTADQDTTKASK